MGRGVGGGGAKFFLKGISFGKQSIGNLRNKLCLFRVGPYSGGGENENGRVTPPESINQMDTRRQHNVYPTLSTRP